MGEVMCQDHVMSQNTTVRVTTRNTTAGTILTMCMHMSYAVAVADDRSLYIIILFIDPYSECMTSCLRQVVENSVGCSLESNSRRYAYLPT